MAPSLTGRVACMGLKSFLKCDSLPFAADSRIVLMRGSCQVGVELGTLGSCALMDASAAGARIEAVWG
mgnify:CR=1 FL=1